MPVLAGLLGLVAQGCERRDLSACLFGWGSGGSQVRWCQGLGSRGSGSAVLLGRARGLVLPGGHGRVGGVVARVWRSVAVSVGRGENLFYLRTDRRREARSLLEGVVAALIAHHAAPGETLILGSSGGGASVPYPS